MTNGKFCQDCYQRHNCRQIYQELGNTKGPSVVFRVLSAFLLPITAFIVSLAAFEEILSKTINTKQLRTVLSFLLALVVTSVCVSITKAINTQLDKER